MVLDFNAQKGIVLPDNRQDLEHLVKNAEFENFSPNHYSVKEMAACDSLLKEINTVNDPYLYYEINRIHTVFERNYKYSKNRQMKAVFSIDKLPGIFDHGKVLKTAETRSLSHLRNNTRNTDTLREKDQIVNDPYVNISINQSSYN